MKTRPYCSLVLDVCPGLAELLCRCSVAALSLCCEAQKEERVIVHNRLFDVVGSSPV